MMSMGDDEIVFLAKAQESLAGAESEFTHGRYNNRANRCYYACFQAAIAALLRAGIQPKSGDRQWGHDYVRAEFVGRLINRRKLYPSIMKEALEQTYLLRQSADYKREEVSEAKTTRALRQARHFVDTVRKKGDYK
jgi:uncharacterized protein (UPF0332 family)